MVFEATSVDVGILFGPGGISIGSNRADTFSGPVEQHSPLRPAEA